MNEEQRVAIMKRRAVFERVLGNATGQELLDMLRADFMERGLMSDNPEQTAYNVGQWELVQYLFDMAKGKPHE